MKFSSKISDEQFAKLWVEVANKKGTSEELVRGFLELVKTEDESALEAAQKLDKSYFYNRAARIRKGLKQLGVELPELPKGQGKRRKKDWGLVAKAVTG